MLLSVDEGGFPFVKMAYRGAVGSLDWNAARDDDYFDAMRRLAKRGRFGVVSDLRALDAATMPGPQVRRRIYEHAQAFYREHAKKVIAVAMVYDSRMMEMLSTSVGWARGDASKEARRSFADLKEAEAWVKERLVAARVLARPRAS